MSDNTADTDELDELPNFNIMVVFGLPVEKLAQATNVENEQSQGKDRNKRRFEADGNARTRDDLVKNLQAKQTRKATQCAVSVFTGLLQYCKVPILATLVTFGITIPKAFGARYFRGSSFSENKYHETKLVYLPCVISKGKFDLQIPLAGEEFGQLCE